MSKHKITFNLIVGRMQMLKIAFVFLYAAIAGRKEVIFTDVSCDRMERNGEEL